MSYIYIYMTYFILTAFLHSRPSIFKMLVYNLRKKWGGGGSQLASNQRILD